MTTSSTAKVRRPQWNAPHQPETGTRYYRCRGPSPCPSSQVAARVIEGYMPKLFVTPPPGMPEHVRGALCAEALPAHRGELSDDLPRSTPGERRARGAASDSEQDLLERRCGHRRRAPLRPPRERAAGREWRRDEYLEVDVVDGAVALDEDGLRVVAHDLAAEEAVAVLFLGGKREACGARRAGFAIAPQLRVARGRGLDGLVEVIVAPAPDGDRGPIERAEDRLDQGRLSGALRSRHVGRIVGAPRAGVERRTAKVGRNDPCPCGDSRRAARRRGRERLAQATLRERLPSRARRPCGNRTRAWDT